MIEQAKRACEILKDNYLSVWKVKIDNNIVEFEKPIDYLIGNPNKAVRITLGINKEDMKYLQECLADIIFHLTDFRTVIIEKADKPILNKYQEVTCLLII